MRRCNLKSAFEMRTDEACRRRVCWPAARSLKLAYTENLSEISSLDRHHHWAFNRIVAQVIFGREIIMKRVALYIRVSTSKQDTENQRRELEAVADRSGWKIVKVYEDAGISGAKGGINALDSTP